MPSLGDGRRVLTLSGEHRPVNGGGELLGSSATGEGTKVNHCSELLGSSEGTSTNGPIELRETAGKYQEV